MPLLASSTGAFWTGAVLLGGIVLAILTTTDPLWWQLHFSRLGAFDDFSGHVFNGGLVSCGVVAMSASIPLHRRIRAGLERGTVADARSLRRLPVTIVALGASLSLIGMIPLTLNEFLHDRAANGVLIFFVVLVVGCRRTLPELPPVLGRTALGVLAVLGTGIVLMVTGIINLTIMEMLVFTSVLTWIHFLERAVARLAVAAPVHRDEAGAEREHEEPVVAGRIDLRAHPTAVRRVSPRRALGRPVAPRSRVAHSGRSAGTAAPTASPLPRARMPRRSGSGVRPLR